MVLLNSMTFHDFPGRVVTLKAAKQTNWLCKLSRVSLPKRDKDF